VTDDGVTRRFVPPLGWPLKLRAVTIDSRPEHGRFVWNTYPRQCIGFVVRLPDSDTGPPDRRGRCLSIMWAKPARWWRQ
jgi:hypothetical protein